MKVSVSSSPLSLVLVLGLTATHPICAQAATLANTRPQVTLMVSAAAETPVSFEATPGARCTIGAGAAHPLVVYADYTGAVRFAARPTATAARELRLAARCADAHANTVVVPLDLRAVAGAVHNPQPAVVADPNFRPPAGFNPVTATDAQLEQLGYPPRPDAFSEPAAYAAWEHAMSVPVTRVAPTHIFRPDRIHRPAQPLKVQNGNVSTNNWDGVVSFGKTGEFNDIQGYWNVPSVAASGPTPAYSSLWAGIDGGFISSDLIQNGTESDVVTVFDWYFTSYYAWYEFYPDGGSSQFSNISINPGDEILSTSIPCTSGGVFGGCYFIEDVTERVAVDGFEPAENPSLFKGNTAEWVLERPQVDGSLWDLPNFGIAATWGMWADDPIQKSWHSFSHYTYDTTSIMNGSDLLANLTPVPSTDSAFYFWWAYK